MTPIEFINIATKLLPEFDGKVENLNKFINALDLLETIKETNEAIAIKLIKTKLNQTVSRLLTNETTIEAIKVTLVTNIKHQSPQNITAKLLSIKQQNKTDNDFAKEVESLTQQLETAYISDGLSPQLAKSYSAQSAVKAIKTNAKSSEVKMLMRAGQFSTASEALTKFIELGAESTDTVNINYINKSRNFNKYRERGNSSQFSQRNNNFNGNIRGRQQSPNYNYNRNNNHRSSNYRGRYKRNRNVRYTEASENSGAPQAAHLGDALN
ncbi:translation initiation factor IF-2-like [Episyrphus balteatus]|uniref:translation initiation factor IF-2-like n=1 Tax=Episyrphus balteatus TaxID=286459 RepID=UPI00248630AF|nr:translation initiation factor IF-2-like [Episyrphus balteatus]